jgi:hypothetical protein
VQTKNERTLRIKTPSGDMFTKIDLNICENLLGLQRHCSHFISWCNVARRSIFSTNINLTELASHSIRLLGNNGRDLLRCYGEKFSLEDLERGFDAKISADKDSIIVCEINQKCLVEHSPEQNASLQLL